MKKLFGNIRENYIKGSLIAKELIEDESGDQMTSFLIVLLVVVVAGATFMGVYSAGIDTIWAALVAKITGLIS